MPSSPVPPVSAAKIGTPAAKSTPAPPSKIKTIKLDWSMILEHAPAPTSDSEDDSEDSEIETKVKKDPIKRKLSESLDKQSSSDSDSEVI